MPGWSTARSRAQRSTTVAVAGSAHYQLEIPFVQVEPSGEPKFRVESRESDLHVGLEAANDEEDGFEWEALALEGVAQDSGTERRPSWHHRAEAVPAQ